MLGRMRSAGVLARPFAGVFTVPGSGGWLQEQWAAHLASGAGVRATHRAAARLLEVEGFDDARVEVTVPHVCRIHVPGVIVHRSTDLAGERRVRRHGLWVTNGTRMLVDLGSVASAAQLEVALDDALRRELTTPDLLLQAIARLGRPGRMGVPALRALLEERGEVDSLTDTGFETLLLRILRQHGLPRPTTQHVLHDDSGAFVMRFDAAYVAEKVGIEADSERWHMNRERFVDDRTKRARAAALGWQVLAFTHGHVTRDGAFVADTVGQTLQRAQRTDRPA
ncbi:MAG: hypothetical protein JJE52_09115 [Acidimicrobiia bacterium]|nr:hypothetical protein [Acidimicrobiia bacterium]